MSFLAPRVDHLFSPPPGGLGCFMISCAPPPLPTWRYFPMSTFTVFFLNQYSILMFPLPSELPLLYFLDVLLLTLLSGPFRSHP